MIPLSRPRITDEDISAVVEVLRSGQLVQGVQVERLEAEIAAHIGVEHAIALSNGTATLHLALLALGIGPGDEVIVPAFSYVATANVVELVGATPVFVDIEPETFNINVAQAELNITGRTKAIIPVHEFGLACDIQTLCEIASHANLHIIEDAACALGATQSNRPVGAFGTFGSFSLHPRKSITSGEGGLLVTSDCELARRIRRLRSHGLEVGDAGIDFLDAGYNYRLTDFQAALALSQYNRLQEILTEKAAIAALYSQLLSPDVVILPLQPTDRNHTWQTYHVLLHEGTDQFKTIKYLRERGIGTNIGAQCIPEQGYYKRKYGIDASKEFPNAYKSYRCGLALPIYAGLATEDVHRIAEVINSI
jgi:perosamine synthetase